jgi:hypothetical protein
MSTGTYKSSSHGAMEFQLQKYHVKYLIRETVFYNGRNTDLVHRERLVLTIGVTEQLTPIITHILGSENNNFFNS